MKKEDLRSKILPTTIENEEEGIKKDEFNTTDLIYIDSIEE